MSVVHLEILVEEPSMEAFLRGLLPRLLPVHISFEIYPFQGKDDMLRKLPDRLQAYSRWLPENYRIVVVVDRDDDDCQQLKAQLEQIAGRAGLLTKTTVGDAGWQLVNRLAIEELEAWYFGDWNAVCQAYPRVAANIPRKRRYRDPDAIQGGTWEALERVLKRAGYFDGGLPKIQVARTLGKLVSPNTNRSKSFQVFRDVIREAASY